MNQLMLQALELMMDSDSTDSQQVKQELNQ